MLDTTFGFNFDKLKARTAFFGGDVVKTIQALQREDYFAIKKQVAEFTEADLQAIFTRLKKNPQVKVTLPQIKNVLAFNLVLAYHCYFDGDNDKVLKALLVSVAKK